VRVVSLGSGSSGNSLLVQMGRTAVLVDAGFGPRILAGRLRLAGAMPKTIAAVLITHEHADHACGAVAFAAQHGVPLIGDGRTLKAVCAQAEARGEGPIRPVERVDLPVAQSMKVGDLEIRSFPTSHDAVAPCGFRLATGAWSVCVATDTGEAQAPMIEAMRGASLLVLEANHDHDRLIAGPYPWPLKRRILSPTGHLSNAQAAEALVSVLDDGPRWVWLAHLSKTNNTPDLARSHVREFLRQRGLGHAVLYVAPPGLGPVWDSATLLGGQEQLSYSAQPAPAASAARRT
jgi:phosphoribosyl 1,2-cyclic phosphodiesterase